MINNITDNDFIIEIFYETFKSTDNSACIIRTIQVYQRIFLNIFLNHQYIYIYTYNQRIYLGQRSIFSGTNLLAPHAIRI